jgi:hypothetical protein
MLAPAASNPCLPWEQGAASDGEDNAMATDSPQDKGKEILHEAATILNPDAPSQSLTPQ